MLDIFSNTNIQDNHITFRTNKNITISSIVTPSLWNNYFFFITTHFKINNKIIFNKYSSKNNNTILKEIFLLEEYLFNNSINPYEIFYYLNNKEISTFGHLLSYIYIHNKDKKSFFNFNNTNVAENITTIKELIEESLSDEEIEQLKELDEELSQLSSAEIKQLEIELELLLDNQDNKDN